MKNFELKNFLIETANKSLVHWNFKWLFQPLSIFEVKEANEEAVRKTSELTVLNIDKDWVWLLTHDLSFWLRTCDVMQDFLWRWEKFDIAVSTPSWEIKTIKVDLERLVICDFEKEIEETEAIETKTLFERKTF